MIISNYELATLIGKLTGDKNTSMAYGAALAVFRDENDPCTVDDIAEIVSQATHRKKRKRLALFEKELCKRIYQMYHDESIDSIPPLPKMSGSGDIERWNKEWSVEQC